MTTTIGQLGSGTFGAFGTQDIAPPKPKAEKTMPELQEDVTKAATAEAEKERVKEKEQLYQAKELAAGDVASKEKFLEERKTPELTEKINKMVEEESRPFVPSKETVNDLTSLFVTTNLLGFLIGGRGKTNAQAAMSAMNGMLEGHQKGRADLYKKEKDIYEENQKALTKSIEQVRNQIKDAIETAGQDAELRQLKIRNALAQHGFTTMLDYYEKNGAVQTLKQAENALKFATDNQTRLEKLKDKADALAEKKIKDQLEAEKFAYEKQRDAARLEEEKRYHDIEAAKTGRGVTQQTAMAQRAVNSLGAVASAVESIKELPAGTTTGLLPNLQTKDGMTNYIRNSIGRKITDADAEIMNTLFTGIGRNLATIEGSGVATGLAELSKQMQSGVYINAGTDDPYKVAIKLADIRRIATENIRPAIDSGLMPEAQRETAEKLVKRIEEAIPFTTKDVVIAHNKGRRTIGETTEAAVSPGKSFATEAEAEAAFNAGTLKSNERVTIGGKTGRWE